MVAIAKALAGESANGAGLTFVERGTKTRHKWSPRMEKAAPSNSLGAAFRGTQFSYSFRLAIGGIGGKENRGWVRYGGKGVVDGCSMGPKVPYSR
jgi:hypothetical protein